MRAAGPSRIAEPHAYSEDMDTTNMARHYIATWLSWPWETRFTTEMKSATSLSGVPR